MPVTVLYLFHVVFILDLVSALASPSAAGVDPRMLNIEKRYSLRILLTIALLDYAYTDCPPPTAPEGVLLDGQAPYTEGSTVYARCPGNAQIIGPVSMECVFGMWVPPFVGSCTSSPSYSCPTPLIPDGARLTRLGPFAMGDEIGLLCDGGGHVIGPSSLSCVFGEWAPPFFGTCSNGRQYSCEVPVPPEGIGLSAQGMLPSGSSVTATCTDDMKVLLGANTIQCVLGNWAPDRFGYCVDITELGKVVYDSGYGQVIVRYPDGPVIKDLGNNQLLIEAFKGGYGIQDVKGYRGIADSEGSTWSIQNNQIFRNGVQIPNSSGNFAIIRLKGFRTLPPGAGLSNLSGVTGVFVENGILYVNGVPMAEQIGGGPTSIEVLHMSSGSSSFNFVSTNTMNIS